MNDLGNKIRQLRISQNLTQQEFGQLFNVSTQAVSKWETNVNIPDITILKEICNHFDIDLNELLNNKKNKKSKISFIPIILILIMIIVIIFYSNDDFEFKTISSNCDNFNISGSIAYNNAKSSIYISNINYCGVKDDNVYQNISCSLYEENDSIKAKIDNCKSKENITLDDYLKDITFNIDNYQKLCHKYNENSLQIEINAIDEQGNIKTYNIPLKLKDNCRTDAG